MIDYMDYKTLKAWERDGKLWEVQYRENGRSITDAVISRSALSATVAFNRNVHNVIPRRILVKNPVSLQRFEVQLRHCLRVIKRKNLGGLLLTLLCLARNHR